LLDGYIWTPMVLSDMIQHLIWMSIEQWPFLLAESLEILTAVIPCF
jgi:hypothetical protein